MQKIINVLAVASFAVSSSIAAGGVYVYVNRDSIIDGVKSQVMGGIGGAALGGGALTGDITTLLHLHLFLLVGWEFLNSK